MRWRRTGSNRSARWFSDTSLGRNRSRLLTDIQGPQAIAIGTALQTFGQQFHLRLQPEFQNAGLGPSRGFPKPQSSAKHVAITKFDVWSRFSFTDSIALLSQALSPARPTDQRAKIGSGTARPHVF